MPNPTPAPASASTTAPASASASASASTSASSSVDINQHETAAIRQALQNLRGGNNSMRKIERAMKQRGGQQPINLNPPPSRDQFTDVYLKEKDDICKRGAYSDVREDRYRVGVRSDTDTIPECTTESHCKKYRDCIGREITTIDEAQTKEDAAGVSKPLTYRAIQATLPITGAPPFPGPTCTRKNSAGVPQRYPNPSPMCSAPRVFTGTYSGGKSRKSRSRSSKKTLSSSRMARRTRSRRSTRKGSRKSRRTTRRTRK